jgi:uncharacterized damage-inducible protein DinB
MHDPKHFIRFFETHQWIISNHLKDVSQAESCHRPDPGGNSLNWVLGHVAASRNDILKLLQEPQVWNSTEAAPYLRGSDGRADTFRPRPLEEIQAALDRSHQSILAKLEKMTPEDLQAPTEKGTIGSDLAFLQFHESYHMGQVGYLRRLLGKEGVIR